MRYNQLDLIAFGAFSGMQIVFPKAERDFHLVFGPNEAGKSTLLRAIRGLTFGIPNDSTDGFRHGNSAIRVGAEIENSSGEKLRFVRRKGRRATLLGADDRELAPEVLSTFLGTVDQAYFSAMFGFGYEELHSGAASLLRGEGALGRALFSASMGGTSVEQVLATLEQEAGRLFAPRARTGSSIKNDVNELKGLNKALKEAEIRPETWRRLEADLAAKEAERETLEQKIAAKRKQAEWLKRCQDALPMITEYLEHQRTLDSLKGLPSLTRDFAERLRNARQRRDTAAAEVTRTGKRIQELVDKVAALKLNPLILQAGPAIDRLHREAVGFFRDETEVQNLRAAILLLEDKLKKASEELGLSGDFSECEARRLTLRQRLAFGEAARELQQRRKELQQAESKLTGLRGAAESAGKSLATIQRRDLSGLREAAKVASAAMEANSSLPAARDQVAAARRLVAEKHRELRGAPSDWLQTSLLVIPDAAAIRRHQDALQRLEREVETEAKRLNDLTRKARTLQGKLTRAQRRAALPTIGDLEAARAERDRGWDLVLAEWKGSGAKEELQPGVPPEVAYPEAVKRADAIADELREEADKIAQHEETLQDLEEVEGEAKIAREELERLGQARDRSMQEWGQLWEGTGITPGEPAEMLTWRDEWLAFGDTFRRFRELEEALERKESQVQAATAVLAATLGKDSSLGFERLANDLHEENRAGEKAEGRGEELTNRISQLEEEIRVAEQLRAEASGAAEKAEAAWKVVCGEFGVEGLESPEVGQNLLDCRVEFDKNLETWKENQTKLGLLENRLATFAGELRAAARAQGLESNELQELEQNLWNELERARGVEKTRELLELELSETRSSLGELQAAHARAETEFEELFQALHLTAGEDLEQMLGRLEQRWKLQDKVEGTRTHLAGLARGEEVEAFVERVAGERAEPIEPRIEELNRAIEAEHDDQERVRSALHDLRTRQREIEQQSSQAADGRQQAKLLESRLTQEAVQFARLRLAIQLLQSQIEEFRRQNQTPLLYRSGEIFKALTCGSFEGLKPEFNEDDEPILVGRRAGGELVPISAMSAGTRDQLYLALRLAATEKHLAEQEPVPLVLDDLLITFDNQRAKAILRVLFDLSRKTQVLMFTHHEHLVQLCCEELGLGSELVRVLSDRVGA